MALKTLVSLRWLGALSAAGLLAACASVPPPTSTLQRAQRQVDTARQAQAAELAPDAMNAAVGRLAKAKAAMASGDYADAGKWADEARIDARLAQTSAELADVQVKVGQYMVENKRLRAQLLSKAPSANDDAADASLPPEANIPGQIVLPEPATAQTAAGNTGEATDDAVPQATAAGTTEGSRSEDRQQDDRPAQPAGETP